MEPSTQPTLNATQATIEQPFPKDTLATLEQPQPISEINDGLVSEITELLSDNIQPTANFTAEISKQILSPNQPSQRTTQLIEHATQPIQPTSEPNQPATQHNQPTQTPTQTTTQASTPTTTQPTSQSTNLHTAQPITTQPLQPTLLVPEPDQPTTNTIEATPVKITPKDMTAINDVLKVTSEKIKDKKDASPEEVDRSGKNPFTKSGKLSRKADYILSHSTITRSNIRISDPDLPSQQETVQAQETEVLLMNSEAVTNGHAGQVVEVTCVKVDTPHTQEAEQVKLATKKKCLCCGCCKICCCSCCVECCGSCCGSCCSKCKAVCCIQ